MNRSNRATLADRVIKAAETSLAAQHYVSSIDVLVGIGWLDRGAVKRWRQGQIDCLEGVVQTNLPRISEAMKLFRSWATGKGLFASETDYVARTPQRGGLRFSRSGNPTIERLYRTHWVSPELSESKRERLVEKASRAPELVVIRPLNREWTCEPRMDLPPVRRHRRSPGDGKSRPGVPALRRPRRSRIPAGGRCAADAPGQGEERAICCRGTV